MSSLKGKVGPFDLEWASVPRGANGSVHVRVNSKETIEIRWKRDADGLWIETPSGVHGFDLSAVLDEGSVSYEVAERQGERTWSALTVTGAGEQASAAGAAAHKKGVRVRAQMPGKIVRVLVKEGDAVEKDQPLLVMEAMKMENEIRAPGPGKVKIVKVTQGQAVESGADLLALE
jgi:biotin carboxyl carrier protein